MVAGILSVQATEVAGIGDSVQQLHVQGLDKLGYPFSPLRPCVSEPKNGASMTDEVAAGEVASRRFLGYIAAGEVASKPSQKVNLDELSICLIGEGTLFYSVLCNAMGS